MHTTVSLQEYFLVIICDNISFLKIHVVTISCQTVKQIFLELEKKLLYLPCLLHLGCED